MGVSSYPSPIERMRETDYQDTAGHRAARTGCYPAGCVAAVVSAAFGIVGILLLALGIDNAIARSSHGVRGSVAVSDCVPVYDDGSLDGFSCVGRFSADDGSFEIPRIEVKPRLAEIPAEPVAAAVSNRHASSAHQMDNVWLVQVVSGLCILILALWMLTGLA